LHSTTRLGGPRLNIAIRFGTENYPTVKNFVDRPTFIRINRIHKCDGWTDGETDSQTDGHRATA